MITKFSVFALGHTEMENPGMEGPDPNSRIATPESIFQAYNQIEEIACEIDQLGYYSMWLAEHHFQSEGYESIPNPLLAALWLAAKTENLKFGCGFNILSLWHPLRLAEDYCMADIFTNGRVILGVGRGYQTRELATFGAPSIKSSVNKKQFEAKVEVLLTSLQNREFKLTNEYYQIPPPGLKFRGKEVSSLKLIPPPKNLNFEVWQPIGSGKSIESMAKRRIKGMVTLNALDVFIDIAKKYQVERARNGDQLELGADLCLGVGVFLADTDLEARETVRPYHDERYKWSSAFGYVRYADDSGNAIGTPGQTVNSVPNLESGIKQGAWLIGSSKSIRMQIEMIESNFPGLDHLIIHIPESMPYSLVREQLRRFSEEIIQPLQSRV